VHRANYFRTPFGPAGRSSATPATSAIPSPRRASRCVPDAELCANALDLTFGGRRSFDDAMSDYHAAATAR